MLNIFKKNEKTESKLASFSAKGLDLNEAELKKVMGGGNGGDTTTTTTIPTPDDSKGTQKKWSPSNF